MIIHSLEEFSIEERRKITEIVNKIVTTINEVQEKKGIPGAYLYSNLLLIMSEITKINPDSKYVEILRGVEFSFNIALNKGLEEREEELKGKKEFF